MFRSRQFIISALIVGVFLSWCGRASAAAAAGGGEAPGLLSGFKCDETTISEAIDLGGGDWSYRYAAKCWVSYRSEFTNADKPGWGQAGPRPKGPVSNGQVVITGVGTYRAKTNTAHDEARLEGNVRHIATGDMYALDLGVQSKYRCTRDPFLYKSGAVCTRKAMTVKGEGWSQFKLLTLRREVPFGTWGITLPVRTQIAKKGKPIPPPPPPQPKEDAEKSPVHLRPGQHHPINKQPTDDDEKKKKKKKKKGKKGKKKKGKKKGKKKKKKETPTRAG